MKFLMKTHTNLALLEKSYHISEEVLSLHLFAHFLSNNSNILIRSY